jgi:hypothetical protein
MPASIKNSKVSQDYQKNMMKNKDLSQKMPKLGKAKA